MNAITARNQAIGVSKKYTNDSLDGIGALKGANIEITSIVYNDIDRRTELNVSWTSNSGIVETDILYLPYGVSITKVRVDDEGKNFIFTDSRGIDLDPIPLPDKLKVQISKEEGNIVVEKSDGLYVPASPVEISESTNNNLSSKDDGLYVPKIGIEYADSKLDSKLVNPSITFAYDNTILKELNIPPNLYVERGNLQKFGSEETLEAYKYTDSTGLLMIYTAIELEATTPIGTPVFNKNMLQVGNIASIDTANGVFKVNVLVDDIEFSYTTYTKETITLHSEGQYIVLTTNAGVYNNIYIDVSDLSPELEFESKDIDWDTEWGS